jgi:hypothetical protein
MLMPLLIKLTDSDVKSADRVVAKASYPFEHSGRTLKEITPTGLPIDQQAALPDLNIELVDRNVEPGGEFRRI